MAHSDGLEVAHGEGEGGEHHRLQAAVREIQQAKPTTGAAQAGRPIRVPRTRPGPAMVSWLPTTAGHESQIGLFATHIVFAYGHTSTSAAEANLLLTKNHHPRAAD